MRIRLLSAVEALPDGTGANPVPLAGLRLSGLLARLALDAGRPVAASVLVEDLWATPPDAPANALQALVSRLRKAIGPELVSTAPRGYRLDLPREAVDALRFADLAARAATTTTDPGTAHALYGQALDLWRGPALADVQELPFAGSAAHRLAQRRADAVEERARLALRLGDPAGELDALTALLDADPLRESTAALLARVLHAAGRQADALAVLDRTRDRLAEELGVDPGPELAATRLAVLRGTLSASPAPAGPVPAEPVPAEPDPAEPVSAAPAPLTSFVGRDDDLRRVRDLVGTARLVTLTGPGGAGKTRLAVEAAGSRSDESLLVELAALTSAEQLLGAVLTAVGGPELLVPVPEEPLDTTARLVTALAGRRLLLVLDNCEHVVAGAAVLAETLLRACPLLRVLATSREPLGVPGEVLHPVGPLPEADAVRLFADRAAAVRPGFAPTPDEAAAVSEICRRLDGQPLPIELAAARMRTMSPAEITARLNDRFRLLTTGSRTALPRHQTLRAVVDWSWDLLSEPERIVAARLAVFAGGATAASAERVCSAPDGPAPEQVFDLLAALVDKSLVVAIPQPGAPTRYRMLETIREYAGERLDASGMRAGAEQAHTALVLELVEAAEPHLRRADQLQWLARLRAEADEIDVALRRAVAGRDTAAAHRIVAAVAWSWLIRGLHEDATRWLDDARELDGPAPPHAVAVNLALHAMTLAGRARYREARANIDAALAITEDLPHPVPPVLELAGPLAAAFQEDPEPVRSLVTGSADPWVRGFAALILAMLAENDGEIDEQRRHLRVAHEEFRRTGDRFGLGMTLNSLGELEDIAGEPGAALRLYDEAIVLATELGNHDDLPQFVVQRASLLARLGDVETARAELRAVLDAPRPLGSAQTHIAMAHIERMAGDIDAARAELDVAAAVTEIAAQLLLVEGDPEGAAFLLGVAARQRGAPHRGSPDVTAVESGARAALGAAAAERAFRQGWELSRDDGLTALLARVGPGSPPAQADGHAVPQAAPAGP